MSFSISSCGVNTTCVVPSRQTCLNFRAKRPSGSCVELGTLGGLPNLPAMVRAEQSLAAFHSTRRSLAIGGRARYLTKISKRSRSPARAEVFA